MSNPFHIVLLPGDGVGPEVLDAGRRLLEAATAPGVIQCTEHDFGGVAIDALGEPLPDDTLTACRQADAVYLGAVGGPKWADLGPGRTPEAGILKLRRELGLFANIRPVRSFADDSGVDFVIVRELIGGIYYGEPRDLGDDVAFNTMRYSKAEVDRVARTAFGFARRRDGRVTSVDKANVLEVSRLWRNTISELRRVEFRDVRLDHMYVDNAAMQVVVDPSQFDVILTGNLFGDILSDLASPLAGSIGVLPSASLGGDVGLFEPVHGSAPGLAGKDCANPVGAMLSGAMLLDELGLADDASRVRNAVRQTIRDGHTTPDMGGDERCSSLAEKIIERLVADRSRPDGGAIP